MFSCPVCVCLPVRLLHSFSQQSWEPEIPETVDECVPLVLTSLRDCLKYGSLGTQRSSESTGCAHQILSYGRVLAPTCQGGRELGSQRQPPYTCHYVSSRTWARPRDKAARGLPGPAARGGARGKPFLGRDISAGLYWGWGSWSLYRENSHLGQILFPSTLGTSPEGPFPSCAGLVPAFGADHGKSMGGSVTLRKAALETAGPEFAF